MFMLGMSGKAHHGKDFCSQIVQEMFAERGHNVGLWAYAAGLKARVYGTLTEEYVLEDVLITKPLFVRDRLQQEGTEQGREVYGEDLWTKHTEMFLEYFKKGFPFMSGIILSDVRFYNEVIQARMGGKVVPHAAVFTEDIATAPGLALYIESDRDTLTGEFAQHESETALDKYDKHLLFDGIIINNRDTTVYDLRIQLAPFVERLIENLK